MDFFSHILIGVFIAVFTLDSLGEEYAVLAGVMAFLPDLDVFLSFFRSTRKSKLLSHKGVSHSYFSAFIVSAFSAIIFSLIMGSSFFIAWLIGFLFYSLHVTLDALAASKIPLFYPISKKRYRFIIMRAINPILGLISGGILIFYLIVRSLSPELYYSKVLAFYFFSIYLIFFAYKLTSKIWIQLRLPKNSHYIPGIIPPIYYIYENHESETLSFKLSKKYQFIPKIYTIIETVIEKDSEEMEYYLKAKSLAEGYLFFSKWEGVIPIFQKNENFIVVLLFLAEGYASGSTYCLEIAFDKKSGNVITKSDGFGRIIAKKNHNS